MRQGLYQEPDIFYSSDFEFMIDRRTIQKSKQPGVHWHDYCEVELVCSGSGLHVINNHPLALMPGSVYLVTPTDFHRICLQESDVLQLYHIQFGCSVLSGSLMQRIMQSHERAPYGLCAQLSGDDLRLMREAFDQLSDEFASHRRDGVMMMRACLERLCLMLLRSAESGLPAEDGAVRAEASSPVGSAIQYIRYHFRNPLTLSSLARYVHLSSNYFGEMFQKSTGMTFSAYLRMCRLEYAHRLLLETELSISEIARESGFRTSSYFSDVFRRQYNMTPSEYRACAAGFSRTPPAPGPDAPVGETR